MNFVPLPIFFNKGMVIFCELGSSPGQANSFYNFFPAFCEYYQVGVVQPVVKTGAKQNLIGAVFNDADKCMAGKIEVVNFFADQPDFIMLVISVDDYFIVKNIVRKGNII